MAKSKKAQSVAMSDDEAGSTQSVHDSGSDSESEKKDNIIELDEASDDESPGINFDLSKLCRTTGWYNNCGLNCLTHFLLYKLERGELELMFAQDPQYNALLQTFQEYYHLPERPTWAQLTVLFGENHYEVPTDREAILAPVLRKHLGKILYDERANEVRVAAVCDAISTYLRTGEVEDVATDFYYADRKWFEDFKTRYDLQLNAANKAKLTRAQTQAARDELLNNNLKVTKKSVSVKAREIIERNIVDALLAEAELAWHNEHAAYYAEYVGTLKNHVMVSGDNLQLLGVRLNIGVEVYTPASIESALLDPAIMQYTHGAQNLPREGYIWLMRVLNRGGAHWEFEHPNEHQEDTQAWIAYHNQFYPAKFNAAKFSQNDKLSGKLKIHGGLGEGKAKTFINHVRQFFDLAPIKDNYACGRSDSQTAAQLAMENLLENLESALSAKKDAEKINDFQQSVIFATNFDALTTLLDNKAKGKKSISAVNKLSEKITGATIEDLKLGRHLLPGYKKPAKAKPKRKDRPEVELEATSSGTPSNKKRKKN